MLKGLGKLLPILLIVVTPLLFVANVWQSYRFNGLEARLQMLENRYLDVLEDNKRMIVGIAGLRSPSRVRRIAEEELGLEAAPADRVDRIRFEGDWGVRE